MKIAIRTVMFVLVAGLVGATAASAQVTETIQFTTAFPIEVGNTKYPAGTFTVRPADDLDEGVLEITNGTTTTALVVEPESANVNKPVKDEVVFKKYGNQYVLSEIWDSADGTGARLAVSQSEQRHAKKEGTPTKESVTTSRARTSRSQ